MVFLYYYYNWSLQEECLQLRNLTTLHLRIVANYWWVWTLLIPASFESIYSLSSGGFLDLGQALNIPLKRTTKEMPCFSNFPSSLPSSFLPPFFTSFPSLLSFYSSLPFFQTMTRDSERQCCVLDKYASSNIYTEHKTRKKKLFHVQSLPLVSTFNWGKSFNYCGC